MKKKSKKKNNVEMRGLVGKWRKFLKHKNMKIVKTQKSENY